MMKTMISDDWTIYLELTEKELAELKEIRKRCGLELEFYDNSKEIQKKVRFV